MAAEASATSVNATSAGPETSPQVPGHAQATKPANVASPEKSSAVVDEDPELDFGDIGKYKRSQIAEQLKNRKKYDASSSKRFTEAAQLRKEAAQEKAQLEEALRGLKENPWALLEKAGLDPDALAEQRLTKAIQRANLTPEQKKLEEFELRNQQLEHQLRAREEQAQKEKHEANVQQWLQHYDREIGAALDVTELPRTEYAVSRVIDVYGQYLEAGEPIDGRLAAEIAQEGIERDTQQLLNGMLKSRDGKVRPDGAARLAKYLGQDICNALATLRVSTLQADEIARKQPKIEKPIIQPKKSNPPTFEEVRKRIGM